MSTVIQGAVIKEQGVTFACVLVKPHILNSNSKANETIRSFGLFFPRMPIVLAAQETRGFSFFGRSDISRFLASLHPSQIPWRKYTFSR